MHRHIAIIHSGLLVLGYLLSLFAYKARSLTYYSLHIKRLFHPSSTWTWTGNNQKFTDKPYSFHRYSLKNNNLDVLPIEKLPNLGLRLRVGPSQVVPNQLGLYLESDETRPQEQVVVRIPQGTPICRYATGYFTDDCKSDKSVGFLFDGSGTDVHTDLVMYHEQLMTLESALHQFWTQRKQKDDSNTQQNRRDMIWGHLVTIQNVSKMQSSNHGTLDNCDDYFAVQIRPQPDFTSWIFEPFDMDNNPGDTFSPLSPTELGKFANDLAFDPAHDGVQSYETASKVRNGLKLIWKLEETSIWNTSSFKWISSKKTPIDTTQTILVPVWPMVIAKYDLAVNVYEPVEIGLEYGYHYWQAYLEKETTQEQHHLS